MFVPLDIPDPLSANRAASCCIRMVISPILKCPYLIYGQDLTLFSVEWLPGPSRWIHGPDSLLLCYLSCLFPYS